MTLDTKLRDGTDVSKLVDSGHVGRRIYGDAEIHELEQERIFRRAWGFLAHESEVPEPGDYVERQLAGEPVLVIRGDDGVVRAFLNSCRHRGMRVCRADRGNASFLRCPYHGWSYGRDGALVSVFAEELYDPENLDKESLSLIPVDQLDSYKGMIFATWSKDTPPLADYLGDMRFYLDILIGRTDAGVEVMGPPQCWEVHTNWKFATDNFTGDNFHLYTAHGFAAELGMLPPDPMSLAFGNLVHVHNGHVLHVVPGPPIPQAEYFGIPMDLRPMLANNLDDAQLQVAKNHAFSVGTVFPNLSFMQVMVQGDMQSPPTPFLSFRVWQSTGPTTAKIWSWLFVEKEASPEYRKATYEAYVRTFGPSGTFEQDDMENWEECTRMNKGAVAQRHTLHHGMAVHLPPDTDFPGPGTAWPGSYGEITQLKFYTEWKRWMTEERPGA
jgi:nitrite reductase/ring-hydroxylating ferredoxin subunit